MTLIEIMTEKIIHSLLSRLKEINDIIDTCSDGMMLFEQLYDQFSEFCSHTPAQRYLRLLDRYPWITEIASYRDITSYLNIFRRQLQRIRESQSRTLPRDKNINPSL